MYGHSPDSFNLEVYVLHFGNFSWKFFFYYFFEDFLLIFFSHLFGIFIREMLGFWIKSLGLFFPIYILHLLSFLFCPEFIFLSLENLYGYNIILTFLSIIKFPLWSFLLSYSYFLILICFLYVERSSQVSGDI